MSTRIAFFGIAAAMMALQGIAEFKQVGQWHMFAGTYSYYHWNSKGSMIFVKGYCSNITISAWMSPDNQWVRTVPETHNTATAIVYVADNFKNLLIHTKTGNNHALLAYAVDTKLTFLRNGGLSTETGEVGPPQISLAGKNLFVAQRLTLIGCVFVGLATPALKTWKMQTAVNTWAGWTPKSAPVAISPHGRYLAVERSYNTVQNKGVFDVYKTGKTLKKMGGATFADAISWVASPQDTFMTYRSVLGPPSVWEAARIGSLDIFCSMPMSSYSLWRIAPSGKGIAALYSPTKTITVRSGAKVFGPFAITDALPGDALYMMYFDGKTVVFSFSNISGTTLRAYHVNAQGLTLVAGPVACGSVMYTHSTKGYFAFSDMAGILKVFTPKLKLVGQASGGIPLFRDRSVLLLNAAVVPQEFTIYRW